MEGSTSLLGGHRLTPKDIEDWVFPTQLIQGYRAADVEKFRRAALSEVQALNRALHERQTNEQELVTEIGRQRQQLNQMGQQIQAAPVHVPEDQHAVSILRTAQAQVDRMMHDSEGQVKQMLSRGAHERDQMIEHARAQAEAILAEARGQAEAARKRIIDGATEEARTAVTRLQALATAIREHLGTNVEDLLRQMSDWEQRVKEASPA